MAKRTRITVDLGSEDLLKTIKIAAIERGKSVRELTIEALQEWLDKRMTEEDKEDLKAMMEAENEYRRTGGRLLADVMKDKDLEERS
jgi:hypothetical protein